MSRRASVGAGIGVASAVAGVSAWCLVLHDVAGPATVGSPFRLTGVAHRYSSRSTVTVTGDECGFRLRWDVLEERVSLRLTSPTPRR